MTPEERDALLGEVQLYGWALQYVVGDDLGCSYAYTAGLFLRELPELVVSGLPPDASWAVLDDVAGRATAGLPLHEGAVVADVPPRLRATLRAVPDTRHLVRARALAGAPVDALHLELAAAGRP